MITNQHRKLTVICGFVFFTIGCAQNSQSEEVSLEKVQLTSFNQNNISHTPCEMSEILFARYEQGGLMIDKEDSIRYMENINFQGDWGAIRRAQEDSGVELDDIVLDYFFSQEDMFISIIFYDQDYDKTNSVNEFLIKDSVYIVDYDLEKGCKSRTLPKKFKPYQKDEMTKRQKDLMNIRHTIKYTTKW